VISRGDALSLRAPRKASISIRIINSLLSGAHGCDSGEARMADERVFEARGRSKGGERLTLRFWQNINISDKKKEKSKKA
jgi:hypothetical protein